MIKLFRHLQDGGKEKHPGYQEVALESAGLSPMEYVKLSPERKEERGRVFHLVDLSLLLFTLSGNDTEAAVLLLGGIGGTWLKFAALY